MGQNGSRSYQIQLCHFVLTSLLQDALLYHGASALSSPPRAAAAENAADRRRRRTEAPKSAKKTSPTGGACLSARQEAGISALEAAATRLAGPKKRQCAPLRVGKHKGGKRVAVRSPRAWGQGRFSAGFVQIDAFCPAPSRPDCRVVSRALRRWRFDPTAAAFLRLRADGVAPPACAPCPARLLS